MSETGAENPIKENPYRCTYRYGCQKYHEYAERCRAAKKTVGDYCRRKYGQYGHWKYVKRGIAVFTLLFVIAYTIITALILHNARDQERRQLRAYLAFNPSAGMENGKPYGLTYQCHFADPGNRSISECTTGDAMDIALKNFGLTPALHLGTCSFFYHADSAKSFDVKAAFQTVINGCAGHIYALRTIWPSATETDSIFFTKEAIDSLQRSANGDGVTFLVSSLTYRDVFGDKHRSNFCEWFTGKFGPHTGADCGADAPSDY